VLGVDFFVAGDSTFMVVKSIEGEEVASSGSDKPLGGKDHVITASSMSVRAAPMFRQSDLSRALRAAQTAGLPVSGFEIAPDGRIVIRTLEDGNADKTTNDWD